MLELGSCKCTVKVTLARDDPNFPNYSCFNFLDIIFVELCCSRLVCIERHFLILWIAQWIKADIFLMDQTFKQFNIIGKQGIS